MRGWGTRWKRARRYGVGQSWRAGVAYRLHDAAVIQGKPLRRDVGALTGFGQHPLLLPTAVPGVTPGWDIEYLEVPQEFGAPTPRVWLDDGGEARQINMPAITRAASLGVRRLRVTAATIQAGQSLIVCDGAALVPELLDRVAVAPGVWEPGAQTCLSPWRKRSGHVAVDDAVSSRMHGLTATLWRTRDAAHVIPRAIALVETVDDHFGHGMLDLLHRLRAVTDLPTSWPIVVSDRIPANVVAWVSILMPGREVIRLKRGVVVWVGELVVPLECARLWLDPARCRGADTVPATIDPSGMKWLQDHGCGDDRSRRRRLWIRRDRSPHCKIAGEDRLVEQARDAGFEDVFLQDLSLTQVRYLMAETSHVIAPMASAVANLTMARPGLRVLQLTDELTWLDRYGSLTWLPAIGHESAVLVGRSTGSAYTVSLGGMRNPMAWLLSDEPAASNAKANH